MKRLVPYSVVAIISMTLVPCVGAQEQVAGQAEYELLAAIAGEYTYEDTWEGESPQTGELVFELIFDGRFLRFEEVWTDPDGDSVRGTGLVGYDSIHGYFTWYRVFDNGAYDLARGRLEDGTLTFDILESQWEPFGEYNTGGPGIKVRTKWTGLSEGGPKSFIWERSVNGGPWERTSEARTTRIR